MSVRKFIEISKGFYIDPDYLDGLSELSLASVDSFFAFDGGEKVGGNKPPQYRARLKFRISRPPTVLYLKRYDNPGKLTQMKNWFWHGNRKSTMSYDLEPAVELAEIGINTPKVICYGHQWGLLFEKRSFIITQELPAKSLEERAPDCFHQPPSPANLMGRRLFIKRLAELAKEFHDAGFRHRDFYLAHIFYSDDGTFYIIDLQRVFKPCLLAERFRVKDIAQLYYSAPGSIFSLTDRLRFYKTYSGKNHLDKADKTFIGKVKRKVNRIARHDSKHDRIVPFAK